MQSIPKTPANIKSITQPRYYATLHEIEGIATITPDGVLFQADGATGPEGTISIDIHEPGLVLAGRCDLADAQREADLEAHPWYRAVQAVAERAKMALGEPSHSRIEKAVQIVLAGGVHLNDDGHSAVVASQSEPRKGYAVNGACPCADFGKAPSHLCKHRLAAHMQRRAMELAQPPSDEPTVPTYTPREVALVAQEALMLPEAPASVNTFIEVRGHRVQITLRDTDETRLLARLEAVLARYAA